MWHYKLLRSKNVAKVLIILVIGSKVSLAPIIVVMIYIANNVDSGNGTNDGLQLLLVMEPIIGTDGRRQLLSPIFIGTNGYWLVPMATIIGSICVKHIIGDMGPGHWCLMFQLPMRQLIDAKLTPTTKIIGAN